MRNGRGSAAADEPPLRRGVLQMLLTDAQSRWHHHSDLYDYRRGLTNDEWMRKQFTTRGKITAACFARRYDCATARGTRRATSQS